MSLVQRELLPIEYDVRIVDTTNALCFINARDWKISMELINDEFEYRPYGSRYVTNVKEKFSGEFKMQAFEDAVMAKLWNATRATSTNAPVWHSEKLTSSAGFQITLSYTPYSTSSVIVTQSSNAAYYNKTTVAATDFYSISGKVLQFHTDVPAGTEFVCDYWRTSATAIKTLSDPFQLRGGGFGIIVMKKVADPTSTAGTDDKKELVFRATDCRIKGNIEWGVKETTVQFDINNVVSNALFMSRKNF